MAQIVTNRGGPSVANGVTAYLVALSVAPTDTVPPSLTWTGRFAGWKPFIFNVIVCNPAGNCTRAGGDCGGGVPSSTISAPAGVDVTLAQATLPTSRARSCTLNCVCTLSFTWTRPE